jgi:N-acetylglucosaminyldiphosphoundecaprenol N-acetyl-beta-D-mannosaminyltransferase
MTGSRTHSGLPSVHYRGGTKLSWGQVIGLPVSVGNMQSVRDAIVELADARRSGYVCVANVHMLVTARLDPLMRNVLERAELVVSDGTPVAWQLRREGFTDAEQVRGPELMLEVCQAAAQTGVSVYFYGGNQSLIDELTLQLERRMPGIKIVGAEAAPMLPMRPEVDMATVERIRASGAQIVFVALGCPKQEFWMRAYSSHLDAILIGVGQAFSITAGHLPEAPRWMRDKGLEWLFRLTMEPKRLWRRYLITNSLFIAFLMWEQLQRLRRRLDTHVPHVP